MSTVILNAKVDPLLKEAVRVVAFNQGHSNKSKTVLRILESDPEIKRELKKLQRRIKEKVMAS